MANRVIISNCSQLATQFQQQSRHHYSVILLDQKESPDQINIHSRTKVFIVLPLISWIIKQKNLQFVGEKLLAKLNLLLDQTPGACHSVHVIISDINRIKYVTESQRSRKKKTLLGCFRDISHRLIQNTATDILTRPPKPLDSIFFSQDISRIEAYCHQLDKFIAVALKPKTYQLSMIGLNHAAYTTDLSLSIISREAFFDTTHTDKTPQSALAPQKFDLNLFYYYGLYGLLLLFIIIPVIMSYCFIRSTPTNEKLLGIAQTDLAQPQNLDRAAAQALNAMPDWKYLLIDYYSIENQLKHAQWQHKIAKLKRIHWHNVDTAIQFNQEAMHDAILFSIPQHRLTRMFPLTTEPKQSFNNLLNRNFSKYEQTRSVEINHAVPAYARPWLIRLEKNHQALVEQQFMTYLNQQWQTQVLGLLNHAVQTTFPFKQTTSNTISLAKLSAIFNTAGKLNTFIKRDLQPILNDKTHFNFIHLSAIARFIDQIQAIQHSLSNIDLKPHVYQLTFHTLSNNTSHIRLHLANHDYYYAHGPRYSISFMWPNSVKTAYASLTLIGFNHQIDYYHYQGEWAPIQLFSQCKLRVNLHLLTCHFANHTLNFDTHTKIERLLQLIHQIQALSIPHYFTVKGNTHDRHLSKS